MREFFKLTIITIIMGIAYLFTEIIYRGGSYWQMALVGGTAGTLTGLASNGTKWNLPLLLQGLIGMVICTLCEFAGGCYFNLYLNCNLWDYSNLPLNFLGQICIYYSIAWFFLSFLVIFLYNFIRWRFFKEERQRYKIL